ncbi:MAG TPA: biotin/lipoyl-containing protein [Anaerolineales bacterium]|nr:biotin/lipoyl-containing protein [Anaerolineales bacterium]
MRYVTTIGDKEFSVEVLGQGRVSIDGKIVEVDLGNISGQPVYSMVIDGKSYEAYVYEGEDEWQVLLLGQQYPAKVEDEREKRLRAAAGGTLAESGEFHLKAPMPGLVITVSVQQGQDVAKGDVLIILESMKMQNELRAPRAGTVSRIKIKPGETVEQRQTLLTIS